MVGGERKRPVWGGHFDGSCWVLTANLLGHTHPGQTGPTEPAHLCFPPAMLYNEIFKMNNYFKNFNILNYVLKYLYRYPLYLLFYNVKIKKINNLNLNIHNKYLIYLSYDIIERFIFRYVP